MNIVILFLYLSVCFFTYIIYCIVECIECFMQITNQKTIHYVEAIKLNCTELYDNDVVDEVLPVCP